MNNKKLVDKQMRNMLYYIKIIEVNKLLHKLSENGFYGKIILAFENGKIVYMKKEETLMEKELEGMLKE